MQKGRWGNVPEMEQECYGSLCCELWSSSPWFPTSLVPHRVEEEMC